jgi:hypothetical protein
MDYNVTVHTLFYNISRDEEINSKSIRLHIRNYLQFISTLKSYYNIQEINKLVDVEPIKYSNIPKYVYVYIAGTIEMISKEISIAVPNWVYDDYYFLSEPWFPEDMNKYLLVKDILIKTTPLPLRKRNLFASEQVISFF